MSAAAPVPGPGSQFHLPSYLLGLVTALVLLGAALFVLRRPEPAAMQLQPPPAATPTAAPAATPAATPGAPAAAASTPAPLVVFVSGAVGHPGLYTLPQGSRIGDAIAAAGGLLPQVDSAFVNQAQPLTDGAQLHIPAAPAGMSPTAASTPQSNMPEPQGATTGQAGAPAELPTTPAAGLTAALPTPTALVHSATLAPDPAGGQTGAATPAQLAGGPINVNTATAAELESLPGIGPSKAQGIVDNRPYASIEDLDRVPGIGPATLERLRPLVTTG